MYIEQEPKKKGAGKFIWATVIAVLFITVVSIGVIKKTETKITSTVPEKLITSNEVEPESQGQGFIPDLNPIAGAAAAVLWNSTEKDPADINVSFGQTLHTWNPLLGGVIWIQSKKIARAQALAFSSYPDNLLVNIKASSNGFGYRFDLNKYLPGPIEYGYFNFKGPLENQPSNLDDIFQIYGASKNVKFILNVPLPHPSLKLGDARFAWQTPQFYGAQLQYLFGTADSKAVYSKLPLSIDFSTEPAEFNWANLRAKRGRIEPYKAEAVIFGEEPYHIEGWDANDGKSYGIAAEAYRVEMRKRGVTLPYGVHVSQLNPTDRSWFHPMMDALSKTDTPKYFDLYHYYTFAGTADWERSFPMSLRVEGFTNWWLDKKTWPVNYARFLWLIDDTKVALARRGIDPKTVKIGFSEHGITISSPFKYNDMTGAIHFAGWLAGIMRSNSDWDSMWVLAAEGFSTAQIQTFKTTTKTPTYFVYQMAMKLRGMKYIDLVATNAAVGKTTNPEGLEVYFPWVMVRAFEDPATGKRELFAINQHPSRPVTLKGLDGWKIEKWEELRGDSYSSGNSLKSSATPVSIKIIPKGENDPITLPPISIIRITLKR
ncbi:hypothetical protein EXS45_01155 [Candidatus Nomurabacteria bacterium]|nr:hypothetical protein [Candidatus Nomurabacteria bacterium]